MTNLDVSPLLRAAVGFDPFADIFATVTRMDGTGPSYPPYNIERFGDDRYRITMAVAGFPEDRLDVTVSDGVLVVRGEAEPEDEEVTYLHRGIAGRSFERRFVLADDVRVVGADLADGLLHINLVREIPEALRPRRIEIKSEGRLQKLNQKLKKSITGKAA